MPLRQRSSRARTPAIERAAYLQKIAAGIRARHADFVEILMREQGKTKMWAETEVGATEGYFDYMASFARHIEGEVIPSDRRGETIILTKRPIGVVAGILPELPLLPHCTQSWCSAHRRMHHCHETIAADTGDLHDILRGR